VNLPTNEEHRTSEWTLKNKRIVIGTNFGGEEVRSNVATFECSHCFRTYTKFVGKTKFDNLTIGENRWEGGWVR